MWVQDLSQALDTVDAALKESIRKLSSFDKYKSEVFSGNLDWTPMHKDPVFWRENITKFEENDYQVVSTVLFSRVVFLKMYIQSFTVHHCFLSEFVISWGRSGTMELWVLNPSRTTGVFIWDMWWFVQTSTSIEILLFGVWYWIHTTYQKVEWRIMSYVSG